MVKAMARCRNAVPLGWKFWEEVSSGLFYVLSSLFSCCKCNPVVCVLLEAVLLFIILFGFQSFHFSFALCDFRMEDLCQLMRHWNCWTASMFLLSASKPSNQIRALLLLIRNHASLRVVVIEIFGVGVTKGAFFGLCYIFIVNSMAGINKRD